MKTYNNPPFVATAKAYGRTVSIELDHSDITIDEFVESMIVLARGLEFADSTIIHGIQNWLEENEDMCTQ